MTTPPFTPPTALPPPPPPAGLLTDGRGNAGRNRSLLPLWIALAVLIGLALIGVVSRLHAESVLKKKTNDAAIPTVTFMEAQPGPAVEEVVLPANVQAWHEAMIYARASGYLKEWRVDIGAPVKAGQVLAVIEAPDVAAQARQAKADLASSEANNQLAQVTAKRWQSLVQSDSVSQQDADTKTANAAAQRANVESNRANLQRLQELSNFTNVTAPFDGTITARLTDTGALINAGSGSGQELFHIAETGRLRVYVQVPETYAGAIAPELVADVYFAEHPHHPYSAKLVSTAEAIDPVTRSLTVQMEMDNGDNMLLSGSYAQVHLKLPANASHVHVPANTLLFRANGLQVATIGENGKAKLQDVTIARDFGKDVEIGSGVEAGQKVIINPPDSVTDGMQVRIVKPDDQKKPPGGKDTGDHAEKKAKDDPLKEN